MNNEHCNTVTLDGSMEKAVVREMIDVSYKLVVKGLRKADRMKLEAMSI